MERKTRAGKFIDRKFAWFGFWPGVRGSGSCARLVVFAARDEKMLLSDETTRSFAKGRMTANGRKDEKPGPDAKSASLIRARLGPRPLRKNIVDGIYIAFYTHEKISARQSSLRNVRLSFGTFFILMTTKILKMDSKIRN